jgi:hypothetical protein
MIIHCLSCGKAISSKGFHCPYCRSEVNSQTMEMNGIEEKSNLKERVRNLMLQFVHR